MKNKRNKLTSLLLGAAVAGLVAGTTTLTSCSGGDSAAAERNGCGGANGCGTAAKKDQNGCNGHNGCKSQNSCKGENGCKGHDATPKKGS